MQKHRNKQNRRSHGWKDFNRKLSESESKRIVSLVEGFDARPEFAFQYLHSEYLSKFCQESDVPAAVRKQNAIDKWLAAEKANAITNDRLRGLDRGFNILPRVTWYQFLRFAQHLMETILGPLSNEVVLGSFSGGASTSRSRRDSHPAVKFTGLADVTRGAYAYVDVIHHEAPLLRQLGIFYLLKEVEGNQLFTVPKKSDIDRCACKEPDINMFLQKGVGRYIRRRLLKFGINLNDQSINRRLAHRASVEGHLATIDLSSASDSITINCVRALLPEEWFLYLNDIRSHSTEVMGRNHRLEMFSSMGNGFTFELESLIFYVLMRTVSYFEGVSGIISVYGDDLIIPTGMFESAHFVLSVFGFTLNQDKSFHEGPFRESCGGHYYLGEDVTPFYLKRVPTHLTDAIRIANQLRRWAFADPCRQYLADIFPLWMELRDMVDESLWGGRDTASDTQLVTPDGPRMRLVRASVPKVVPQLGSYAAWHCTNWNRTAEPDETGFQVVSTYNLCRKRRATPGALVVADEFHEELFGTPDS